MEAHSFPARRAVELNWYRDQAECEMAFPDYRRHTLRMILKTGRWEKRGSRELIELLAQESYTGTWTHNASSGLCFPIHRSEIHIASVVYHREAQPLPFIPT
jgi:hypothetical protein